MTLVRDPPEHQPLVAAAAIGQGVAPEAIEDGVLGLEVMTGHQRNDHHPVPLAFGHSRVVSRGAGLAKRDADRG